MFSNFFIKRPRFAVVLSLLITIVGILAFSKLPLEEYPAITPPQVVISAAYPGASSEVVEKTVAAPIESAVNGVDNMIYMSSTSYDGSYQLTVYFKVGTDPDMAVVNIQNRIQLANSRLPEEVRRMGLSVKKQVEGPGMMIVALHSPNGEYDNIFLGNYASTNIKDNLLRVNGVGDIDIFGGKDYGMRIWLQPDKMAGLGITPADVINAVQLQNSQFPAGAVGEEPLFNKQKLQFTLRTTGRLKTPEDFENIIVKSSPGGACVKLRDIARVELGAESYSSRGRLNGKDCVVLRIHQQSEANIFTVAKDVKKELNKISQSLPQGMKCEVIRDETEFIQKSFEEVFHTILEAIILVIIVTYLFLGDKRSTLVPFLAIPVSLIGTFAGLNALGFSINTLTLFGLVLAIGLVVDDAIIVIENVQRHINVGMSPVEATKKTMEEVSGAVIATSMVLLAVFVPVAFLPGISGQLYRQFAVGMSISIAISTLIALTLSPALCATIIKSKKDITPNKILLKFNNWFKSFTFVYLKGVKFFLSEKKTSIITLAGIVVVISGLYLIIPKGFIPNEDKGAIFSMVQLPQGSSLSRTDDIVTKVESGIQNIKGVRNVLSFTGFGGANSAFIVSILDNWDERKSADTSIRALIGEHNKTFSQVPDARIFAFTPSPIPGLGSMGGFEFEIQDTGDLSYGELETVANNFIMQANQDRKLTSVFTTYQSNVPQILVDVDEAKALSQGVPLNEVYSTLLSQFGSYYINDFNKSGRIFKVQMQADSAFREKPSDIQKIYVRNMYGKMLPIGSIVTISQVTGPSSVERFNMFRSVKITGQSAPGVSSGDAIKEVEKLAKSLPSNIKYEWSGVSRQEIESSGQTQIILTLSLIFVYLLLVGLYESWTLPIGVILTAPITIVGGLFIQFVTGYSFDLYSQMGLVMLMGLATKQAILVIEFAKAQRDKGVSIVNAAIMAANLRFRAVIMTSFTFLLGVLPLVFASGAGAESRKSIGTTVFGGMLFAVVIGSLLVPVFYVAIQTIKEKFVKEVKENKTTSVDEEEKALKI